jgi:hypothetical protein
LESVYLEDGERMVWHSKMVSWELVKAIPELWTLVQDLRKRMQAKEDQPAQEESTVPAPTSGGHDPDPFAVHEDDGNVDAPEHAPAPVQSELDLLVMTATARRDLQIKWMRLKI